MNARTRLSAAWYGLRTGRDYADGYDHGQTDGFNSATGLIREHGAANTDHTTARVAVEHFPPGQPRLRVLAGGA